jgi:hypothetical protein
VNTGPLGGVSFSPDQLRELRYASLLHDFGKVGVREHVLVKEKKLYPSDLALLRERHAYLVRSADWRLERARADYLERHGRAGYEGFLAGLRRSHEDDLARMAQFLRVVLEANEPTVLPRETRSRLEQYARETFEDVNGEVRNLLDPHELRLLSISQGNLDEEERLAIQRHVAHTYDFLRQIPWTRDLAGVPTIAFGHHEKLDGSGYPRGARGDEIPIQTRMMTISDIYDALTAADRSYKPAVAPDRALDILASEVRAGMLDPGVRSALRRAPAAMPRLAGTKKASTSPLTCENHGRTCSRNPSTESPAITAARPRAARPADSLPQAHATIAPKSPRLSRFACRMFSLAAAMV